ncbi:Blue copper -like protein [Tripterygium wilfordii]|uniref:Blue copper -like protein n=1 Tax=Tripterygium wilfordii TaxID=458696 RepID=A0A7J7BVF5_TRIWF|nr:umecyanin-like [Tripterygium wilfordii]KAF5725834.1 Blue copper -like protein [Tripterygium wilfordii]
MAALLALLLVTGSFVGSSQAVEYVVGDTTGWTVPSTTTFYSTWASGKNFSVGDVLVFNFATRAHDVAVVTEDAYQNCNIASPINQTNTGPARITLSNDTDYYFICTISGHCSGGQKLEIDVGGTTNSSTPTPGSPPGTTTTSPPPPSSAASSFVAALFVSLSSIAIGFLY